MSSRVAGCTGTPGALGTPSAGKISQRVVEAAAKAYDAPRQHLNTTAGRLRQDIEAAIRAADEAHSYRAMLAYMSGWRPVGDEDPC
jgi:hypothetical protein